VLGRATRLITHSSRFPLGDRPPAGHSPPLVPRLRMPFSMKRVSSFLNASLLGALLAAPVVLRADTQPPPPAARDAQGVTVTLPGGLLRLEPVTEGIVRVAFARDAAFFRRDSLMLDPHRPQGTAFTLTESPDSVVVATAKLQARLDRATGAVTFLDAAGRILLAEQPGSRMLADAEVQGVKTLHVQQAWQPHDDESLYGFGQNHLGLLDLKGYDLDLWQHNGTVFVPFLVSSRGYGILWDNNSSTRFGDLRPFDFIPAGQLLDTAGQPGGLTGTYFADNHFGQQVGRRTDARIDILPAGPPAPRSVIHPALPARGAFSVRWEGSLVPAVSGVYQLQGYSDGDFKLWIDGQLVANHWRQGWLPWYDLVRVQLEAGRRHAVKLEWIADDNPPIAQLRWKTPSNLTATSLWSEFAGGTDYYFVAGQNLDAVIAGYRTLTGAASLMPRWAFGLWQSRQRYKTQQELLDTVKGFRTRGIPFDNIVMDWFYWKAEAWGSHEFDPARFPDPAGMVRSVHDLNARIMISVWPKFYPGTANFEALHSAGFLYERNLQEKIQDWVGFRYTFYDAFNPAARKLFWSQVERELFRKGIDAWWLDATEPDLTRNPTLENQRNYANPTALGPGAAVVNAFSIENAKAVYEGQRAVAPDQRVFILTRSGFAGLQRLGSASWSGDTSSTWTALRKQIPAALSFSLAGVPYWTMDVGGFAVPGRFAPQKPVDPNQSPGEPQFEPQTPAEAEEWAELNTRWFQFGTFVPLLRVHGEYPFREMWEFGGDQSPTYQAQLKFDRLRYRLLPYLYSVAGAVTHEGTTFLRPLVMDFPNDPAVRSLTDEFLFGPALLVSPVTEYRVRRRAVALPATPGGWYDFWTGTALAGGRTIDAPAPFDAIPLHIRAGAIIPFGPEVQWTGEKQADPITVVVYAGADGAFTLYEDDGLTYGYERGASARIPLRWDDAKKTLTIGARTGTFPGMLTERTFNVVLVAPQKPIGFSFTPAADKAVHYIGEAVTVGL